MFKRFVRLMLMGTLALTILAGCGTNDAAQSNVLARVGTMPITEAQFTAYMEQQAPNIQSALSSGQFDANSVRQFLFQRLIQEEIALSEARRNGSGIDSTTPRRIYQDLKWDTTAFASLPTEATTPSGASYKFASSSEYQEFLLRQSALDAWSSTVNVPNGPESYDLQAIIVDAQSRSPEEALNIANQALAELRAGADFADVARKYSESPSVASDGGRLGYITLDPNDPNSEPLLSTLRNTPLNQVTDALNLGQVVVVLKPLATASFTSWDQLVNSVGSEYLQQKVQEYTDNGQLVYYGDPVNIPLPATVNK